MSGFFRFPHTPHIAWLGDGTPRDDKLLDLSAVDNLLADSVVVEEKLDGANLGFSISCDGELRAQNRGQYLREPFSGQFSGLSAWLALHGGDLFDALEERLIAFGEWCAARHSLDYSHLPDWWLLFDIYDRREQKFWSTQRRDALAHEAGLSTVARIAEGRQTSADLKKLTEETASKYRHGALEGIVVRRENSDWLLSRGKLVRPDFTQAITTHWRNRKLEWNRIDWSHQTQFSPNTEPDQP